MAALADLTAQATADELVGVLSSRRLRYLHMARELRRRPRLSVNQRNEHGGASWIGEHAPDGGEIRDRMSVERHIGSMRFRGFGLRRTLGQAWSSA